MKQHIRTGSIQLCLVGLLAFVAACGNRDDTTAPTANGTIVVTLTIPGGATPNVTVTGPNGYSHVISSTTTLQHLAAGSYIITADSIVTQSTIVGYSVDTAAITGNPIVVTSSGSSAATITYAFARQHGALWVTSNSNSFLSGFARSQLLVSGVVVAADTIGHLNTPPGLAFDASGNLWVATNGVDTLKMYTVAQRNTGSAITAPARVLVSSSISSPQAMSFDSHGNLWIADYDNGLLQFSAAQLAAGGTAGAATIALTDTIPPTEGAYAVAFDAAGNAWVGENDDSNVIEYTVAQLAATGSPTPNVRLGATPGPPPRIVGGHGDAGASRTGGGVAFGIVPAILYDPDALAFDANGNLWVANYYNANVVAYSPSQRTTSGNPTPSITLSIPGADPYGITFDKSGGLWVTDDNEYSVRGYTAAQIAASGAPTPNVLLTSAVNASINDPQQLAFDEWVVPTTPAAPGSRVPYLRSVATRKVGVNKPGHNR